MKQLFSFLVMLLLLSCSGEKGPIDVRLINVKDAMNIVQPIPLAEITSEVTYIPLEKTEMSLIGDTADIRVFHDYILVSSAHKNLKLFDRKTGKFLREIGHIGKDSQGHGTDLGGISTYWIDCQRNLIYVKDWGNGWKVYDVQNQYVKKIEFEDYYKYYVEQIAFLMDDNMIYGLNKLVVNSVAPCLFSYDCSSEVFDEIPGLIRYYLPYKDWIKGSSSFIYDGYVSYGGKMMKEKFVGNRQAVTVINSPSLWKSENQIRVKQPFNDTIYTIRKNQIKPSYIFDLGDWHWKVAERLDVTNCEHKIAIDYTLETPKFLYFHFHIGLYTDIPLPYCGIYRKDTGEVKVMQGETWTDTKYNQELQIRNCTNDGRFYGLIPPEKFSKELMKQFQLTEDDNPVVVVL